MTDYAAAVQALYDALGTWEKVADACGFEKKQRNYFRKVSRGEIKKPGISARRGIRSATGAHVTGLLLPRGRAARGGLTVKRPLWFAINRWRIRHKMSWDEWHTKAHELMVKEYEE